MGIKNSKQVGIEVFQLISSKKEIGFEEQIWENLFNDFSFDSSFIELKQLFLDSYQHIAELGL